MVGGGTSGTGHVEMRIPEHYSFSGLNGTSFGPNDREGDRRKVQRSNNTCYKSVIRVALPLASPTANRKRVCSEKRVRADGAKKIKV